MKHTFKVGDKVRLIVGEDHPNASSLLLNAHGVFPSELINRKIYTIGNINDFTTGLYLREANWWVELGAVAPAYHFVEELD